MLHKTYRKTREVHKKDEKRKKLKRFNDFWVFKRLKNSTLILALANYYK